MPEKDLNPYWEKVERTAARQRAKGISQYGKGIEANPADIFTRIEMYREELVDALMYLGWVEDYLKEVLTKEEN